MVDLVRSTSRYASPVNEDTTRRPAAADRANSPVIARLASLTIAIVEFGRCCAAKIGASIANSTGSLKSDYEFHYFFAFFFSQASHFFL